ncbi:hypothetical protein HRbin24_00022 [bacterium HR24]|nr:hypothetical protein [Chloroflexota bacterium]GBD12022.1 hypothetical protein HRbin24_00022 [bacterium HR24]
MPSPSSTDPRPRGHLLRAALQARKGRPVAVVLRDGRALVGILSRFEGHLAFWRLDSLVLTVPAEQGGAMTVAVPLRKVAAVVDG